MSKLVEFIQGEFDLAKAARIALAIQHHDLANMMFDSDYELYSVIDQKPCGICGLDERCPLRR